MGAISMRRETSPAHCTSSIHSSMARLTPTIHTQALLALPRPPGPPGPHPHPGPPPPPPSGPPHFPHQEPVYALNVSVPTLLANHSLNVHIIQFEHRSPLPPHRSFFPTRVIVQGHPVLPDIVARNGAVHVVDRVLNPIKHHHHHKHHHDHDRGPDDGVAAKDEWEDWEEWLPKWAEEN